MTSRYYPRRQKYYLGRTLTDFPKHKFIAKPPIVLENVVEKTYFLVQQFYQTNNISISSF